MVIYFFSKKNWSSYVLVGNLVGGRFLLLGNFVDGQFCVG